MADHLRAELVLDAMEAAVGQRRPKDVINHSDQGSQPGLNWSSQHLEEGGSDGGSAAFGSGFAGEVEVIRRPGVARREDRRQFCALIADGLSSEDAAMVVGISQPVGTRWFRVEGGMAPSHLSRSSKPLSGRYLLFAEREEISLLRAQGLGVREVARRLGRSASTVS